MVKSISVGEESIVYSTIDDNKPLKIESFFDAKTMSVHIKENMHVKAKKGMPGEVSLVSVSENKLSRAEVQELIADILAQVDKREDSMIETERESSRVIQAGKIRIVITRPPLSDSIEITAVRPIRKLTLQEYRLTEKLERRIASQAEGILVAGAPGEGKSTFIQALAERYGEHEKIIKTIEAPRDLDLPSSITRYSLNHSKPKEIYDILLLSRPDYTLFDEMRTTEDFKLFSDLRLSGVGMVGVVHATNPVDAIQRFIGRIELGIIPHIIDTVIFVKGGRVSKVFEIKMEVKVPEGMKEADLARPIVVVNDFETRKQEYEIYSYGEDTVVVAIGEKADDKKFGASKIIISYVSEYFKRYYDDARAEMIGSDSVKVFVSKKEIARIIGKDRTNIRKIEEELGLKIILEGIDVKEDKKNMKTEKVTFTVGFTEKCIQLEVGEKYFDKLIDAYVGDEFLVAVKPGRKGAIKIKQDSDVGKLIQQGIKKGILRLVV